MKKILMIIWICSAFTGAYGQIEIPDGCKPEQVVKLADMIPTPVYIRVVNNGLDDFVTIDGGLKVRNRANDDKEEKDQNYALKIEGAVHIGDGYSFDDLNDRDVLSGSLDTANITALEDAKLFVEDMIAAEDMTYMFKEDWDDWPDYVFEEKYDLPSLSFLKTFIDENKHLPKIPSQAEVRAFGVNDKKMGMLLLEKVEELTIHTIRQEEILQEQEQFNADILNILNTLDAQVQNLSAYIKSE